MITEKRKETIKLIIAVTILALVLLGVAIAMIKYEVEGETNMPFTLKKIQTISSAEATTKSENPENYKWKIDINQYNDIYIELQNSHHWNS